MPDDFLWLRTASELTAAYACGEATPQAALESVLSRLEDVNGRLNAVVSTDVAGARQAAEESGVRWRAGIALGRLDGVPITVKDNLFVGGLRATWGSLLFANHVAPQDDLPVAALRNAGAVILGKTNTPEFALSGHTDNRLFGSTGNPWDPSRSVGGSSGGAVAAVAGGIGPIAIGTDAGGSIRRPSGLAGLVGLKPGLSRVPRRYGFPPLAHDLQVIGPIARCVDDVYAAFATIAVEPTPLPAKRKLRIVALEGFLDVPVDEEVKVAFSEGIAVLRNLGHHVERVAPLWEPEDVSAIFTGLAAVGVAHVVRHFSDWRERATPHIRAMAEAGATHDAASYVDLLDRVTAFRWRMADAFSDFDVLVTPTSATVGWPRTEPYPATIDGRPAGPRAGSVFSTAINLAALPALSVPAPVPEHTMPIGLQFVGSVRSEELLLRLAAEIETAAPWPRLAPLR